MPFKPKYVLLTFWESGENREQRGANYKALSSVLLYISVIFNSWFCMKAGYVKRKSGFRSYAGSSFGYALSINMQNKHGLVFDMGI